jgi:hypothetical protein
VVDVHPHEYAQKLNSLTARPPKAIRAFLPIELSETAEPANVRCGVLGVFSTERRHATLALASLDLRGAANGHVVVA